MLASWITSQEDQTSLLESGVYAIPEAQYFYGHVRLDSGEGVPGITIELQQQETCTSGTTESLLSTVLTRAGGDYGVNGIATCSESCACSLKLVEKPLPYEAVSASAPNPATVISPTEIKYDVIPGAYGEHDNNDFVLNDDAVTYPVEIVRKYYYAGSQRVAMRVSGDPKLEKNGLYYLLTDHLGSTSVVVKEDGNVQSEALYAPWGETRAGSVNTDYRYTGQQQFARTGLYYYGARWYDAYLNRWIQPDVIIPSEDGYYSPLTVDYH
jgi:RHS repeat-associated protein